MISNEESLIVAEDEEVKRIRDILKKAPKCAFPVETKIGDATLVDNGMQLRDWFAGQALANVGLREFVGGPAIDVLAKYAYELANAMMEARSNESKAVSSKDTIRVKETMCAFITKPDGKVIDVS